MPSLSDSILALALALPEHSAVSVPREWIIAQLLDAVTEQPEVATLPSNVAPSTGGSLISVEEAATRIGVKPSWIYRKQRALPFLVRVGTRALRCDDAKMEKWIARSVVR